MSCSLVVKKLLKIHIKRNLRQGDSFEHNRSSNVLANARLKRRLLSVFLKPIMSNIFSMRSNNKNGRELYEANVMRKVVRLSYTNFQVIFNYFTLNVSMVMRHKLWLIHNCILQYIFYYDGKLYFMTACISYSLLL